MGKYHREESLGPELGIIVRLTLTSQCYLVQECSGPNPNELADDDVVLHELNVVVEPSWGAHGSA